MKHISGIFVTALILFVVAYILLRMWGINILSFLNFGKILLSILIVVVTAVVVWVIFAFAFKNPAKGYDQNSKGIAQKKID